MKNRRIYNLRCDCHFIEHQGTFDYWADDPDFVYVSFSLTDNYKWYQRLWLGIKYIFGYRSEYGHFAEVVMNRESVEELRDYLDSFVQANEKYSEG